MLATLHHKSAQYQSEEKGKDGFLWPCLRGQTSADLQTVFLTPSDFFSSFSHERHKARDYKTHMIQFVSDISEAIRLYIFHNIPNYTLPGQNSTNVSLQSLKFFVTMKNSSMLIYPQNEWNNHCSIKDHINMHAVFTSQVKLTSGPVTWLYLLIQKPKESQHPDKLELLQVFLLQIKANPCSRKMDTSHVPETASYSTTQERRFLCSAWPSICHGCTDAMVKTSMWHSWDEK